MARSVRQAPDGTPTILAPRANPDLVGHEYAERELQRLLDAGRVPHAILLSGLRGIGKATLAFRFARFLLATRDHSTEEPTKSGLAIAPESGVFRRVAAGGHADLLTVERAYDPRRRRLRSEIVVEDAREITSFVPSGWIKIALAICFSGMSRMRRSSQLES